jgi:hypothetical protein
MSGRLHAVMCLMWYSEEDREGPVGMFGKWYSTLIL